MSRFFCLGVSLICALPCLVAAAEPRDRKWLIDYVNQAVPDNARNQRYLGLINRALERSGDRYLRLDVAWLEKGGGDGYRAREQTNAIGTLAFCFRTPELLYYQDPILLERLRRAYLAVAAHVTPQGQFVWPGDQDMYWAGSHEHAWRLEPLLIGYIWVGDRFPEADRRVIEAMLDRAAGWLVSNPTLQHNNRGAVWCAITTLCGLYFERPEYLALVEKHAGEIMNSVVLDDGEVGEHTSQYSGGGPCTNYSFTSISYVYLYRLLSGRNEMDPRLLGAGRWFAAWMTPGGLPVVAGASVRRAYADLPSLDVLPLFERLSRTEPFMGHLADALMDRQTARSRRGFGGHIISPVIWAMLEPRGPAATQPPLWYTHHTQVYDRPQVQYALFGRTYRTGVTLRGTMKEGYEFHLRGMQTFAFDGEGPILHHSGDAHSTVLADGIDTAERNVDHGPAGWEAWLTQGPHADATDPDLATLVERRGPVWTIYAATPVSFVAVTGGVKGPITHRWTMAHPYVPEPQLDANARRVTFPDRKGQVHFLSGSAQIRTEGNASLLQVVATDGTNAFAFSKEGFGFDASSKAGPELRFHDSSGRYQLSLADVLGADGNLNRAAPMRLTRLADAP